MNGDRKFKFANFNLMIYNLIRKDPNKICQDRKLGDLPMLWSKLLPVI